MKSIPSFTLEKGKTQAGKRKRMKDILSPAIVKENLKRFRGISLLAFFLLFFSGPYVLLMNAAGSGYSSDGFITMLLNNQNTGYLFTECALPVVLAVSIFSYLNKPGSVNAIHSLPVSRKKLFLSNYVSGVLLFLIPLVLIALITLILVISGGEARYAAYEGIRNGYDISEIFRWLFTSFTNCLFVFGMSCLACMVSGNGVIASLTACAFNLVIPVTELCILGLAANEYWGFSGESGLYELLVYSHPAIGLTLQFSRLWLVLFFLAAIGLMVLGLLAYGKRKLERATDSYVFTPVRQIVGFLFEFYCATILGLAFYSEWGIMAYIAGGVFGFLIGQMISGKTFRVFGLENLKNLAVFSVTVALILFVIHLDIAGYQTRIPSPEEVQEVCIQYSSYNYEKEFYDSNCLLFTDEESIDAALQTHEKLIDEKNTLKQEAESSLYEDVWIQIEYRLKNGKSMWREYTDVPVEYISELSSKN